MKCPHCGRRMIKYKEDSLRTPKGKVKQYRFYSCKDCGYQDYKIINKCIDKK